MNLKIAAIQAGKSGKDISEKMRLSPSTISRWLSGETPVPTQYIRPLAKFLGINPLDVLPPAPQRKTHARPGAGEER